MGEKAIKGNAITKVLSCLVVIVFLMSTFSVAVIATDSANSTASNVTDKANSSVESIALSNNITGLTCRDDLIQININKTETVVNESVNSDLSDASNTSSPDIINESDEVPDPDLPVINDTDVDTAKIVSSMSSCSYVWIKVTDKYCYGYKVYVDGVYQFTEGQSGTPDGYCCFKVTPGYHTFKLTLNGKEVSKGWNCQCGHVYNWVSMNDMIPHWCEGGGGNCDNPPTVNFDKSTYYEGDTVHATVSTIHGSVYYKIIDCSGTVRESGYVSNGGSIYYTIPSGASECCYWKICFYWNEGTPPLGLLGTGGEVTTESYQCVKCYSFYVCPPETPCKVWISVEDKYCEGYKVYVDGGYVLTENGDGYCRFHVTPGTHKFELRKDGCSVSKSWYCQCGTSYRWISMNDMYPHWCDCNKKPDLVVQDISWSPSNPKLGDTVTITVKTKNQGSENAGGFYVCYYVDGSYYDRDYVSSLSAGSTTTTSFSWTADCGSHSIKAVADCYSDVEESNEGNNARTEYINIVCKPDLITQDIYWSPSNQKEGDTVTFSVKTKNQGSESAGGFYVCYYVDGSYYTRDYVSSLSAGSTTTTSFTWTADCGSHSIKAVADCYDAITESNEGNNARTEYINIVCKPDLVVQNIFWSPSNPKQGDTVTVNVKTKNKGSESAGGFYVCYYVDGSYYTRDYVSSLSAGSTTTTSFTWTAECGNHAIKAVADCYDAVVESDEENNWMSKGGLNIPCKPDLIVQDISWDKGSPKRGDTITFYVKVKNQGSGSAGTSTVKYYIDGSYVTSDSVPSLSAGSTSTQTFTWKANKCGNVQVKAVADATNAVAESNEGNNARTETVSVICLFYIRPACQDVNGNHLDGVSYEFVDYYPAYKGTCDYNEYIKAPGFGTYKVKFTKGYLEATVTLESHLKTFAGTVVTLREKEKKSDLIILDTSWSPENPKQGDTVTFTVTVKNIGEGTAKKSTTYIHLINFDTPKVLFLYFPSCPSLKPGGTYTYTRNAKIEDCGRYSFVAGVDIDEKVNESNEGNNYKRIDVTVPCKKEKPDLIISDISMSPSSPKQGDDVKFTVTVKNIGKGTAKKSTTLIYLINGDIPTVLFLYFPSCPPLRPGVTHTYTKNAKIEDCGRYGFKAIVDVSKEVDESNEENNYKDASFEVPCTKEEETLVVNVYSIDGKPAAEVKGTTTVELIKSGDVSPTAKQNINDKSRVTFTDIPAGNYYINVYHNPQLEQGSKEFWGQRKDISITAGTTTTIDFYRYNPYVEKFYAEKNSVEANTPVKINVGIKVPSNCPDAEAYVKASVILKDENGDVVYRDKSDDREVQRGDSTSFSFSYTPIREGTYSGIAKAYIVGGGELCTDNCGWMKVFTCSKEEQDLIIQDISWEPKNPESGDPVDFTITVKNAGTKDVDSAIYVDFETGATQQPRKKVADSLKSGETATVTYNGILKKYCLSYLAQATVDPDNTIVESDENNNYKVETVDIAMKYALIVGINNYDDKEISQLDTAVRYANKMKKLLISGYNYDEVKLLTEEDATKHTIGEYLTQFSEKVDLNDIFVFYFFGHGTNNTYHKEGIVAHDLHRLSDEDFVEISNNFKGTVICIFESCNSGGMAYDTDNSNGKTGIDRDNAIVLMSCQANEDSYENKIRFFPWLSDAIYPKYLYEAFVNKRQDVDKNNDGKIALEEAHNYAWKKTIAFADSHGKSQHPQIMDHYKSKSHPEAYCYFSRHPINPEFING